jgi:hypothetical protein
MKVKFNFILLIFLVFFLKNLLAQAPRKFDYQTILTNNKGQYLANQTTNAKITILQFDSISKKRQEIYSENHVKETNKFGLLKLEIGTGEVVKGNFNYIDWLKDTCFIKTEIDISGNGVYAFNSTKELICSPIASFSNNGIPLITSTDFDNLKQLQGKHLQNCNGKLNWGCDTENANFIIDCKNALFSDLENLTTPQYSINWDDMGNEYEYEYYLPAYAKIPIVLIESGTIISQSYTPVNGKGLSVYIPEQELTKNGENYITIKLYGPINGSGEISFPILLGEQNCELKLTIP